MNKAARLNLPRVPCSPTRILGRASEIAAIVALLKDGQQRLVTLTGAGGAGKSALALAIATALAPDLPTIGYVDFGAIRRDEDPAGHLGQTLCPGLPATGTSADNLAALVNPLGHPGSPCLLIWDNFEHLVRRAGFAADLLAACPNLLLLITSRAPLRIRGEREVPVPPLSLPEPNADPSAIVADPAAAVALFVERARATRYNFALTDANAADIAGICRRLDGLPLAIELAAARIKLLPPATLLRQLDARPELLSGGPRDAPDRQQTLQNTVAWSYDLLETSEQVVFRRLATIPGDWPLDAALAVAGDADQGAESATLPDDPILQALSTLIEHHLVERINAADDGSVEPRFAMRTSIRAFGQELIAGTNEAVLAHRIHAAWCLATTETTAFYLAGPDQAYWLDRIERDRTSIVAALRWFIEAGHNKDALRLAAALGRFWGVRGHREDERTLLAAALAATTPTTDPALRIRALRVLGNLWYDRGQFAAAREPYVAALDLLGSSQIGAEHANLWSNLALIDLECGALDQAIARLHDVIAVRRDLEQPRSLGHDLNLLGEILLARGETGSAIAALDEALGVLTNAGDLRLVAVCLTLRGEAARRAHDLPRAHADLKRGLDLAHAIGDGFAAAAALGHLAQLADDEGRPETALGHYHDALKLRLDQGETTATIPLVDGLARCIATHAPDLAVALHDAAARWSAGARPGDVPCHLEEVLTEIAAVRQTLAPATSEDLADHHVIEPETMSAEPPLATAAFRLSKRESEVLRLLVGGLTDREIAGVLAISQRTVTWHVTNVYDKLGVSSRLEAGVLAVQKGLV